MWPYLECHFHIHGLPIRGFNVIMGELMAYLYVSISLIIPINHSFPVIQLDLTFRSLPRNKYVSNLLTVHGGLIWCKILLKNYL